MNIFVCVKQVPDTETKISLNSDNSSIDTSGIKWIMNPYDKNAVEEALKLKEEQSGAKVVAVSVGPKDRIATTLREALAMGADEAILVDAPEGLDAHLTAQALAKTIAAEGPWDILFTGHLAIDDNASSVSQMLAENLKVPHATVVSKFEFQAGKTNVERESEGGAKEIVELQGPSIVAATKSLNKPRYTNPMGIMKAKKKPLKEVTLESLGVSPEAIRVGLNDYMLPPEKPPVTMISGEANQQAKELTRLLREDAKVI